MLYAILSVDCGAWYDDIRFANYIENGSEAYRRDKTGTGLTAHLSRRLAAGMGGQG